MADGTIEFGEPEIHVDGMTFGFEWKRDGNVFVRIMAQDVRQDGEYIFADCTVWWLLDQPMGVRPIMPKAQIKLNSGHSTGWSTVSRHCEKRISGVDWTGAMTIVADECITQFEEGSPNIRLGEEVSEGANPFILKPYISASGATVMYGEGGISKSLLALAMSLSVSTGVPIFGQEPVVVGPVMYFDYEDDSSTHDRRLQALCRSFGIPLDEVQVYHHALVASVTKSKREMRKRAEEVGAVLGILDSVGMGRGGSAIAAEDTIRMFRGLREVGIPFLAIDHVSKKSKDEKGGDVDAYGSIYTMNSARLGWSLTRQLTGHGDSDAIHLHATNTKANHIRKLPPQTISIKYTNDERGVPKTIDIETGNEFGMLMPTVGTHQRMMMWIVGTGNEWQTYADMEEELGIPSTTMRSVVARDEGRTFETKKVGKRNLVRCVASPVQQDATDGATGEDSE